MTTTTARRTEVTDLRAVGTAIAEASPDSAVNQPSLDLRFDDSHMHAVLTRRKGEVVAGLARGLTVRAIADELGTTLRDINNRLCVIRRRTGARTNAHIVAWAFASGLLQPAAPVPTEIVAMKVPVNEGAEEDEPMPRADTVTQDPLQPLSVLEASSGVVPQRYRQIIHLLSQGSSVAEIAHVSETPVYRAGLDIADLRARTQTRNHPHLISWAYNVGLLQPGWHARTPQHRIHAALRPLAPVFGRTAEVQRRKQLMLRLVAEGLTKEIADALDRNPNTKSKSTGVVNSAFDHMLSVAGARVRAELVTYAYEQRLLIPRWMLDHEVTP